MLMKHADIESAKKACERITDMFYETSFMLKGEKFEFDMEVVASDLNTDKTVTELLSAILDMLARTGRDAEHYMVLEDGGEK